MPKKSPTNPGFVAKPYTEHLPAALLEAFATNNRINQYLIENLPPDAWTAKPPDGKGRTIAAIVAHMHNVRVMWLKAAKAQDIPDQLNRATVTSAQAIRGLESSHEALTHLAGRALQTDGRTKDFDQGCRIPCLSHRDDAHHRGQIAMLARQLGHPLPQKVVFGMWEWGSR